MSRARSPLAIGTNVGSLLTLNAPKRYRIALLWVSFVLAVEQVGSGWL
jgi:hypothetical protein